MKRYLILVIALVALLGIVGSAAEYPRIGLITATGGLGDKSFNDGSFKGATAAAQAIADQYGVTVEDVLDYVEPSDIAEYELLQVTFADSGEYTIIMCIGFDQKTALESVAAQYPDQLFGIVDETVLLPNVVSLRFNDWESAYLIGVAAGLMTETDTIGFEGGMEFPLIVGFMKGYTQGAQSVNPDVEVLVRYVGAWDNPTLGAELAREMYDTGADIVYGAAGKSHLGVFTAAQEADGRFAMGTDVDQALTEPSAAGVIIGSGQKRVDLAVEDTINRAIAGTFVGEELWFGIVGDLGYGTGIYLGGSNVSPYVQASMSEITVPCDVILGVLEAVEDIRTGTVVIDH